MTTQERTTPVAAPSQKQLKTKILELAKRKNYIDQPGRLVAHIINELKLTSHSSIREPIIMALEGLERDGLIAIDRNGTVMNTMVYIEPKTVATHTSAPKTPTRQRATTAAIKQPADHLSPARPRRTMTAKVPEPTSPQPEATTDESPFVRLVEKAERLKEELTASQQEAADAKSALADKERELAKAQAATAQANANKTELARQLAEARDALNESSEINELLTADNRRLDKANRDLQDQVDAYQHLEARALRLLDE